MTQKPKDMKTYTEHTEQEINEIVLGMYYEGIEEAVLDRTGELIIVYDNGTFEIV